MLLLMGPGTIGLAATQVNVFVNTVLATSQGTGAVSWLNYAFRLMYLPIGLFGVSIATAALPAVSRHAAARRHRRRSARRWRTSSLMLMLNVPATVGLIVLAHRPSCGSSSSAGASLPADTAATAAALRSTPSGCSATPVVRIASPTFYALRRQPHAGDRQRRVRARSTWRSTSRSCALLGFRGLALGTVARRRSQRRGAAVPAAAPPRRPRRRSRHEGARPSWAVSASDERRGGGRTPRSSHGCPATGFTGACLRAGTSPARRPSRQTRGTRSRCADDGQHAERRRRSCRSAG